MSFDLIVEALIGYGLRNIPESPVKEMIEWANRQSALRIALDVPAALEATLGRTMETRFKADVILTLALPKHGLTNKIAGKILLADLGIPEGIFQKIIPNYKSPFDQTFIAELDRI